MAKPLDDLVALLRLERLEENRFRGDSQDPGWGTVFGGQALGQALSAAIQAKGACDAGAIAVDSGITSHAVAAALGHEAFRTTAESYAQRDAVAGAQQKRVLGVLAGGKLAS